MARRALIRVPIRVPIHPPVHVRPYARIHAPIRDALLSARLAAVLPAILPAILSAILTAAAVAPASADLQPLVRSVPAVPGAPVLVPVRVVGADRGAQVALRGGAGAPERRCEARLAWPVNVVDAASLGRWATASNAIRLEAARPAGSSDAYLVVSLPGDAFPAEFEARGRTTRGTTLELAIDGRVVRLDCLPPAEPALLDRLAARASRLVPQGAPDERLSRPDPSAPFERFRATIGTAIRGWDAPPDFVPGSLDADAARATTALWLAALARIAATSEGVAAEVAETLVATCGDPTSSAPIAAWLAAPGEVGALLALALDRSREDDAVVEAVASWLGVRSPLLAWIDDETRDAIVLALANPTASEEVVRLQWILADEPPLAAVVPPAEVLRVRLARPARASIDGIAIADDAVDRLRIENRGQARIFDVAPAVVAAGVAGTSFASFAPPLDLVGVARGARRTGVPVPPTLASVRPRLDGWEIFIEARTGVAGGTGAQSPTLDVVEVVGPRGEVLAISSDGAVDDPTGVLADGASVAFARHADRYRASLPVPSAWIDRDDGRALVALGFRRRIGGTTGGAPGIAFDAPRAATPWSAVPRTFVLDLFGRAPR